MASITTPPLRQIRLVRLAHVYYTHKNITKATQFLEDFGFKETKRVGKLIYYRGTGPEPFVYCAREGDADEFGGAAFVVETREDLDYASQTLPGASKVYELDDAQAPGGGFCTTFKDPVDGFPFHLVYGQTPANDTKVLPQLKYNFVCCPISRISQARLTRLSPRRSIDRPITPRDSNLVSIWQ